MTTRLLSSTTLLLAFLLAATLANAQTKNLLQNPNGDTYTQFWLTYGQVTVELSGNGNRCFVVRNGGYLLQDVPLPTGAVGQYALLIGRGSSERINPDGAITGLPYLSGYMMEAGRDGRILANLQGQNMSASASRENEWVTMKGIFRVPEGTKTIRFFLNQAERRGLPHNGSATRFSDIGLFLFATKEDAQSFANSYP